MRGVCIGRFDVWRAHEIAAYGSEEKKDLEERNELVTICG